jgi:O-antigen/teichoic acid export membrane protein
MPAANIEMDRPASETQRATFFRQSGWLMIANIGGGALMWLVHFLAKAIPAGEYGTFGVLLSVVMLLPTMPLQMILAQQTAKALATRQERQLSGVIRLFVFGTLAGWIVCSIVVLMYRGSILHQWKMTDPTGIYITLPIVLLSVWLPLFWGILQGQQNFLWLGWSMLSNGVGRIAIAAAAVLLIRAYSTGMMMATGMMMGVLCGLALAAAIAIWQTRAIWLVEPAAFDWQPLLKQVLPLLLGFFGFQILFTVDTLFVKAYFSETEAGFYVAAGTLSRALMWLVGPLASVMFPKIVQSAARKEKSNLMNLVLMGTAALSIVGAIGLSIVGPLVIRMVYKSSYVAGASSILPWYAAAMVPLTVANVLLNNLLARPSSKGLLAVLVFCLAISYGVALTQFHDSMVTVLKTAGLCNLVLALVCAWFTWGPKKAVAQVQPAT